MSFTISCTTDAKGIAEPTPNSVSVLSCVEPPLLFDGASIGRDLPYALSKLSGQVSTGARDLLAIAMGVTAADTFVSRDAAADGWCRLLHLVVPVQGIGACLGIREQLQELLYFLSGDMWTIEFVPGDEWELPAVRDAVPLGHATCASLFSGGLDSAIGALDLMAEGARPLLVSHAYPKDAAKQQSILPLLPPGYLHLAFNADPRCPAIAHDVSMRTRSFNFFAVGAAAAEAIAVTRNKASVDLVVPENGFIALNPPLTPRRLGSHSTRTTHPHFLAGYQSILDGLGIRARIVNPYRALTKGGMIRGCKDQDRLARLACMTVSCGKWKRRNRQCGRCVPCIIRRAAFRHAAMADTTVYEHADLQDAMTHPIHRDDILAMCLAAQRPRSGMAAWAVQSGPLPADDSEYGEWVDVAWRGIREVAGLLKHEGVQV
jgi:hypothetical protein